MLLFVKTHKTRKNKTLEDGNVYVNNSQLYVYFVRLLVSTLASLSWRHPTGLVLTDNLEIDLGCEKNKRSRFPGKVDKREREKKYDRGRKGGKRPIKMNGTRGDGRFRGNGRKDGAWPVKESEGWHRKIMEEHEMDTRVLEVSGAS